MNTTTTTTAETVHTHRATIDGLRALAAFLEDHPNLPISEVRASFHVLTQDDKAGLAKLAQVATELDTQIIGTCGRPLGPDSTHYYASRSFGPVAYEACYVRQREMADWGALMSYDGAIQPGDPS